MAMESVSWSVFQDCSMSHQSPINASHFHFLETNARSLKIAGLKLMPGIHNAIAQKNARNL